MPPKTQPLAPAESHQVVSREGEIKKIDLQHFEDYSWLQFVKLFLNYPIYSFRFFYELKRLLMKYSESEDYVNWGYWSQGVNTQEPCLELVLRTVEALHLEKGATLLDVGSGLGGPDRVIIRHFPEIRKIIGINISAPQIAYATDTVKRLGLDEKITYQLLDATTGMELLRAKGINFVICIEALAEMADLENVFRGCQSILPPGGRIAFCDIVRTMPLGSSWWQRLAGNLLMVVTKVIFNDHWRSVDEYTNALRLANFYDIKVESIGDKVFLPFCEYAKGQFDAVRHYEPFPPYIRFLAYWFARANVFALRHLPDLGQIDYVIISAQKKPELELENEVKDAGAAAEKDPETKVVEKPQTGCSYFSYCKKFMFFAAAAATVAIGVEVAMLTARS